MGYRSDNGFSPTYLFIIIGVRRRERIFESGPDYEVCLVLYFFHQIG